MLCCHTNTRSLTFECHVIKNKRIITAFIKFGSTKNLDNLGTLPLLLLNAYFLSLCYFPVDRLPS